MMDRLLFRPRSKSGSRIWLGNNLPFDTLLPKTVFCFLYIGGLCAFGWQYWLTWRRQAITIDRTQHWIGSLDGRGEIEQRVNRIQSGEGGCQEKHVKNCFLLIKIWFRTKSKNQFLFTCKASSWWAWWRGGGCQGGQELLTGCRTPGLWPDQEDSYVKMI